MSDSSSFILSAILVLLAVFAREAYRNARIQQVAAINVRSFLFKMTQELARFTTESLGILSHKQLQFSDSSVPGILDDIRTAYEQNTPCFDLLNNLAECFDIEETGIYKDGKLSEVVISISFAHCKSYNFMDKVEYSAGVNRIAAILHSLQSDITYPYGKEVSHLDVGLHSKLAYLRNIYLTILQHSSALMVRMRVNPVTDGMAKHVALENIEVSRQQKILYTQAAEVWDAADKILNHSTAGLAFKNIAASWKFTFRKLQFWKWFR